MRGLHATADQRSRGSGYRCVRLLGAFGSGEDLWMHGNLPGDRTSQTRTRPGNACTHAILRPIQPIQSTSTSLPSSPYNGPIGFGGTTSCQILGLGKLSGISTQCINIIIVNVHLVSLHCSNCINQWQTRSIRMPVKPDQLRRTSLIL